MGLPAALDELSRLLPELPAMLGDAWAERESRLVALYRELASASDDLEAAQAALQLLQELVVFREVRDRLVPLLAPSDSRHADIDGRDPSWSTVMRHMRLAVPHHWVVHGPEDRPGVRPPGTATNATRALRAWFADREPTDPTSLRADEPVTIGFQVGALDAPNLLAGDVAVGADDIPEGGLRTRWVVRSKDVELASARARMAPVRDPDGMWRVRFGLRIPRERSSSIVRVVATPRVTGVATIEVSVYVGAELYRQSSIELVVGEGATPPAVRDDHQWVAAAHADLHTTHEWTTPPGSLTLTIRGNEMEWIEDRGARHRESVHERPGDGGLKGLIENVRVALDGFREAHTDYLDDLDAEDLLDRLASADRGYLVDVWGEWPDLPDLADARHRARWLELATSDELFKVASDGHALARAMLGDVLVEKLAALPPAFRVTVKWRNATVKSLPWGLMYLAPPRRGEPVDPFWFAGLRFRLGYSVYPVEDLSRALGGLDEAHHAHLLYWGSEDNDEAGVEARWQQQQMTAAPLAVLLPTTSTDPAQAKDELVRYLGEPSPRPTSILYLFCHCTVDRGENPVLRFDARRDPDVQLDRYDLAFATTKLADQPLVFANACATSEATSDVGSLLESGFFQRGCRAFIGTEAKVPIRLASRFARIVFAFLLRQVDPQRRPMSAGEAMTQARLFLWCHYRNIGGLFYSYVNEYELYLATEDEVRSLSRR